MVEPAPKPPSIDQILTDITGRSRPDSIRAKKCSFCGGDASEFKDELSIKEYSISGFCQTCQDKAFEDEDE